MQFVNVFFFCQLNYFTNYSSSNMFILKRLRYYDINFATRLQTHITTQSVFILDIKQITVLV